MRPPHAAAEKSYEQVMSALGLDGFNEAAARGGGKGHRSPARLPDATSLQ